MLFGEYLRTLRRQRGLTAQELGTRINTTGQYITQLEQGKLRAPNKEMACKMAEILEINPEMLWGLAALERHREWCEKEGIEPDRAITFLHAAMFERKKIAQKLLRSV